MTENGYKDLELDAGRNLPGGGVKETDSQGQPTKQVIGGIFVLLGVWLLWLSYTRPECPAASLISAYSGIEKLVESGINGSVAIDLKSPAGAALLRHPQTISRPYFEGGLGMHFATQITTAYCGVASMAMVLNSLSLPFDERPQSPLWVAGNYRYFDQDNLFDECMRENVMHEAGVYHPPYGITRSQLSKYLACHTDSDNRPGDSIPDGAKGLSAMLAREMATPGHLLIANYHRGAIGQSGGGHHSPLAAYSPTKDMVLIMDVARYKYGPVWFPVKSLFSAINTTDSCGEWTQDEVNDPPEWTIPASNEPLATGEVCSTIDLEKLNDNFQNPVCTPAQRGIVLACAQGSAACKL